MKKEILYNKKSREELQAELQNETFIRKTFSFYRYINIDQPEVLRNELYRSWSKLNIFGRIYISTEGINAQGSCPESNWGELIETLKSNVILKEMPLKIAIEDGESFYKLKIKVKDEIVAYNVGKEEYNMNEVGHHLSAEEFNKKMAQDNTLVVDMRNYYESEVGRFENAIIPDVDT